MPSFDPQGGLPLILTRALAVAAMLWLFGGLMFRVVVVGRAFRSLPDPVARKLHRRLLVLNQAGAMAGLVALPAWLLGQTADLAGASSFRQAVALVPAVAAHTMFGHLVVGQIVATLAAALALGRHDDRSKRHLALACASVALALQAGHSHAAAMAQSHPLLLAADLLHLAGAGAWLGGLPPLLLVVRRAPVRAAASAARWFTPLGKLCILAVTASAAVQGWQLVGTIPGLVGTAYGWVIALKSLLLAVLLAFAALNRYRFAPALLGHRPDAARTILLRSLTLQTGVGMAVVAAATLLSSLPPAMHTQPVWPFATRFSLAALREDPELRREVVGACVALACAAMLAALPLAVRWRWRLAAPACAAVVAWRAVPHLAPLLVTAYPTSFYHSPTGFTADAVAQGSALYPASCAACHGGSGQGDGPAAAKLPVPPADLTAAHLWQHDDGELFWWLSHGMQTPEGAPAMPGFSPALSDDQLWDLIDFIRARNAGLAFRDAGAWPMALRAPGFSAICADDSPLALADLRGRFVRLVFGAASNVPGVTTIATEAARGMCSAYDEAVRTAYALVAGVPEARLPGMQFLIDPEGVLRAVHRRDDPLDWNDPAVLSAEIARLRTHPLASPPVAAHMDMKM